MELSLLLQCLQTASVSLSNGTYERKKDNLVEIHLIERDIRRHVLDSLDNDI